MVGVQPEAWAARPEVDFTAYLLLRGSKRSGWGPDLLRGALAKADSGT